MSALHTRPFSVLISTRGADVAPTDTFSIVINTNMPGFFNNEPNSYEYAVSTSGGATLIQDIPLNHATLGLIDSNGTPVERTYYALNSTTLIRLEVNGSVCGIITAFGNMEENIDPNVCQGWEHLSNDSTPAVITYTRCDGSFREISLPVNEWICLEPNSTIGGGDASKMYYLDGEEGCNPANSWDSANLII